MNNLAKVFIFKITATVLVWCMPLILLPASWLTAVGFPEQETLMFVRMLGWAYLALCVGYWFGLKDALDGRRAKGPIWVGVISNAGACMYLLYYGSSGAWASWGTLLAIVGWASFLATFLITTGLLAFGVFGRDQAL